jgi:hypothetical protein
MARISEGRALECRCLCAKSGLSLRMFWMSGSRKPMVFPVPVLACAILHRYVRNTHVPQRSRLTYRFLVGLD